jgi:hypothetical protein
VRGVVAHGLDAPTLLDRVTILAADAADHGGSSYAIWVFDSAAHLMMGLVGVGATLAFTGLLVFVLLTVWAVFLGKSNAGKPMESW